MSLIKEKDYFARYGELLSEKGNPRKAWECLEKQLFAETDGFRKYLTYEAFRVAHYRHRRGHRNSIIILRVFEMFVN
jgi:hypothetical protein